MISGLVHAMHTDGKAPVISHTWAVLKNCNKLGTNSYNIMAKYNTVILHCLFTLAHTAGLHLPRAHTDVVPGTQELGVRDPHNCTHGGQGVGS